MKQRVISAFIAIIVLVAVLAAPSVVFDIAAMALATLGVFEIIEAVGMLKYKTMSVISLLMPTLFLLTEYFLPKYSIALVFLFLGALLLVMLFDHSRYSFSTVATFFTIAMLVSITFVHVSLTRRMDNGIFNLFIIFIGCWITDTCAYFSGMLFGKHKLAPLISPKKTVEGSIGGVVGVTVIISAYVLVVGNIMSSMTVNILPAIFIGLLSGIISQFGDLCASVIKREHNIKDFGKIMPGHGGVMDRFDSFIFVAPAVYYLLKLFPIFI